MRKFMELHGNFSLFCVEPIGSAAPKFSTSSETLGSYKVLTGVQFALLCPAQASPVPGFR